MSPLLSYSCWLSFESGALYGFIVPVALIVLVSIFGDFHFSLFFFSQLNSKLQYRLRECVSNVILCFVVSSHITFLNFEKNTLYQINQ